MRARALNCTLGRGTDPSSTEVLLREVLDALRAQGVDETELERVVDHDVRAGVTSDEGDGDEWPALPQRVFDADILVLGTPIWLGQPSSMGKRVLERMDAFLGETDDAGCMVSFGRVGLVAFWGTEDGAHHVSDELDQALDDVGFTIAATPSPTGRRGDAGDGPQGRPPSTREDAPRTEGAVRIAVDLARLLQASPYPGSRRARPGRA